MYGPGPIPVPPHPREHPVVRALWVVWRIVLTAVPVVSVGLLAWVPFAWILAVRRRVRDGVLLGVCLAVIAAVFVLIGESRTDSDWQGNVGTALVLLLSATASVYALMADLQLARLRRERRLAAAAPAAGAWHPGLPPHPGQFGPAAAVPPPVAGGPQLPSAPAASAPPVPSAPHPPVPQAPSASPVPYPPYPGAVPAPAGPVPADGRIAQVRAELDDLSRLLREQGGGAE